MAVPKLPCFNYQTTDDLTPAEIRPIWEYARKRYLDNGVSYEETITQLMRETGAPPGFFEKVFVGPKSFRVKTREIFAKEDARRTAKYKAQQWIDRANNPGWWKFIRAVGDLPRAGLTAFHGGVFPVTHGGALLLRPSAWRAFIRGSRISWGVFDVPNWAGGGRGRAFYEAERLRLQNEMPGGPENRAASYAEWRQALLKIGVDERAQGILSGWLASSPGWSARSWLGLMRMRYELADGMLKHWEKMKRLPGGTLKAMSQEERLDLMKHIAEIANHSTGVTQLQMGGKFGKAITGAFFAPQLTASKFARVTFDPIDAVTTAVKMMSGKPVTIGERAAMYIRVAHMGEFLGTWAAGLMVNDALLQEFGSDQKINWFHPSKGDWLRYKTGEGHVMATRGPEEALRLFGQLIAVSWAMRRELHGHTPQDEMMDVIQRDLQYKMSPGYATDMELAAGTDIFGRPLPEAVQQARMALGMERRYPRAGKPQYTLPEYLLTHSPIFMTGAARDVYESMREQGMSEPDAQAIVSAAILTAAEFAGFGGYRERPSIQQPTRSKKGVKTYP